MTREGPLLLAGGGHSHALILKRWAMHPHHRPDREVVLVNRHATALYSGMVPGLIAGIYSYADVSIDLRTLCDRAGVAFITAEIQALDRKKQLLHLQDRPALSFDLLSLNLGAVSRDTAQGIPIKPLEPALEFLQQHDAEPEQPFRVIGAGAAGLEVVLALRRRWPDKPLTLQQRHGQLTRALERTLQAAAIRLVTEESTTQEPTLLCTGSCAPKWLASSGLPVDPNGRVKTDACLRVNGSQQLFASGDCAVIADVPRPASGVWAVRAARPLARNLEAAAKKQTLHPWQPQRHALQLLGDSTSATPRAWAQRGRWQLGPNRLLWQLKQRIDKRFMAGFQASQTMATAQPMACRGCAAKLPAASLTAALRQANLAELGCMPQDAAVLGGEPTRLQSVDGFPALVSDPWLNGRLTALHACSDLWACGARVDSALSVITLPTVAPTLQQELLVQTLAGVQSTLAEQDAHLIGGHTLESRSTAPKPASLGIQVTLSVNGTPATPSSQPWLKQGIQPKDALLLSRPLGSGVLFAAAMAGRGTPSVLDAVLKTMAISQHKLLDQLLPLATEIHACTDITGFGLLGHLSEMLSPDSSICIHLQPDLIPAYPTALDLLRQGEASSLAPANRLAWRWLEPSPQAATAPIVLEGDPKPELLELLVDPQTCGPLLIACNQAAANLLTAHGPWIQIGNARPWRD